MRLHVDDAWDMVVTSLPPYQQLEPVLQQVPQEPQVVEHDGEAQPAEDNQHGYPEVEVIVMYDERVEHVPAQRGDAGVAEGGDGVEQGVEQLLARAAGQRPPDVHVDAVCADALDEEGDEQDVEYHAEQPAGLLLAQDVFQHYLAHEGGLPHEGEGEEGGEGHHPDAAYLYQRHDDDVPRRGEARRHVHRGEARHADAGGGDEQGVDEGYPVGRGVRQGQQPRAHQYHEHEAEQEQQRGLDVDARQGEDLAGEVDDAQPQQQRVDEHRPPEEIEVGQRVRHDLLEEQAVRQHGEEQEVDAHVEIEHLLLDDFPHTREVPQRDAGEEREQEALPRVP